MLGTVLAIEALWEKVGLKKTFEDIGKANRAPSSYSERFWRWWPTAFVRPMTGRLGSLAANRPVMD